MGEKVNQRVRLTKQLLKNSLMEMLETESIQNIAIKNLCSHADINRSTFYKYYGSQFDLLREIEEEAVENVIAILKSHPNGKADALLEICRYLNQNELFVRPLITNDSDFMKMIFSHPLIQEEIHRSLEPMVEEAKREYVFDFIAYGSARIVRLWLNKPDRESPEEIAALLSSLMRL